MFAEGIGKLLQRPTIRDLDLKTEMFRAWNTAADDLAQIVAKGLRATRLRRFHWTARGRKKASAASMTELCKVIGENRNLMDIRLKGQCWVSEDLSCPFTFLDFISLRNQYRSQVLMQDANTLPPGLWPLILESASCNCSVLYYLLKLQPHLVKGKVKSPFDADTDKPVDGPSPKRSRIN